MSMLTAQVENLRIMARLVRNYDHREISRALREAADTIENLHNRLTETCHMTLCAVGSDYARYRCSECEQETMAPRVVVEGVSCGYERPSYCVNCGRQVVE